MADTGPSGRFGHAVTFDSKMKRVVLFGGGTRAQQFGDTWSWDGTEWTQEQDTGTSRPNQLTRWRMTLLRDRVVLFGGSEPRFPE